MLQQVERQTDSGTETLYIGLCVFRVLAQSHLPFLPLNAKRQFCSLARNFLKDSGFCDVKIFRIPDMTLLPAKMLLAASKARPASGDYQSKSGKFCLSCCCCLSSLHNVPCDDWFRDKATKTSVILQC